MIKTIEEARRTRYGSWAGSPKGNEYNEGQCCKEVFDKWHTRQCSKKNGFGINGLYCKQHGFDPSKAKKIMVYKVNLNKPSIELFEATRTTATRIYYTYESLGGTKENWYSKVGFRGIIEYFEDFNEAKKYVLEELRNTLKFHEDAVIEYQNKIKTAEVEFIKWYNKERK